MCWWAPAPCPRWGLRTWTGSRTRAPTPSLESRWRARPPGRRWAALTSSSSTSIGQGKKKSWVHLRPSERPLRFLGIRSRWRCRGCVIACGDCDFGFDSRNRLFHNISVFAPIFCFSFHDNHFQRQAFLCLPFLYSLFSLLLFFFLFLCLQVVQR